MNNFIFIEGVSLDDIGPETISTDIDLDNVIDNLKTDFIVVDQFEDMETLTNDEVSRVVNADSELPNIYTDIDNWPKSTNLACWYCSLCFKGKPWFIPVAWTRGVIDREKVTYDINLNFPQSDQCIETTIIRTDGNFCSPFCAKRYIEEYKKYTPNIRKKNINMLHYQCEQFLGYNPNYIPSAPDKTKMKKYCGESGITESEYQKLIKRNYKFMNTK
jgi:hypothetical protein